MRNLPSENKWAAVKRDYETGCYNTNQLSVKYNISKVSINKAIKKGSWEKGVLQKIADNIIRQKIVEELCEQEASPALVAKDIKDLLNAEKVIRVPTGKIDIKGNQIFEKEVVPDLEMRDKGIGRYFEVTGAKVPTSEGSKTVNIKNVDMKSVNLNSSNAQELSQTYQQLLKLKVGE